MKRVGDGPKAGPKVSSPAGLQVQGLKTSPRQSTPWDNNTVKNSLNGRGMIPGGRENQIQAGAGTVAPRYSGAQVGLAYGNSSQSSMKGAATKPYKGSGRAGSVSEANSGSPGLSKMILKAGDRKGQSQVQLKAPSKEPRPTGVPATKNINYHKTLGFSDKGMP